MNNKHSSWWWLPLGLVVTILKSHAAEHTLLRITNSIPPSLAVVTLTETQTHFVRNIAGRSITNEGGLLSLSEETSNPVRHTNRTNVLWRGFVQFNLAPSVETEMLHAADLLADSEPGKLRLLLGRYNDFSIYTIATNSVPLLREGANVIEFLHPPGLSMPSLENQLSPPQGKFFGKVPLIKELKLSREGRFWVVAVNGTTQFKYSTWTGSWSSNPVPKDE